MIYIDTGAFIARHLKRDQYYDKAIRYWKNLQTHHERCFTSNFVLDETFTMLGRRAGYKFAVQRARNIFLSDTITILRPVREDELKAIDLFEKYSNLRIESSGYFLLISILSLRVLKSSPKRNIKTPAIYTPEELMEV